MTRKLFTISLSLALIAAGMVLTMGQAGPGVSKQTPITVSGDRTRFTDRSGVIAVGGTSQTLVAANTLRKRIIIQNPCTAASQGIAASENLFINFTSAATITGGNSIELAACGSYDSGLGPVTTEAITVNATTVNHQFVAKEM